MNFFRSKAKMVRKYFAGVHRLSISITPWWTGWKNKPSLLRGYHAPEFCSFTRDAFENLMGQRRTKAQLPNNFSHRAYTSNLFFDCDWLFFYGAQGNSTDIYFLSWYKSSRNKVQSKRYESVKRRVSTLPLYNVAPPSAVLITTLLFSRSLEAKKLCTLDRRFQIGQRSFLRDHAHYIIILHTQLTQNLTSNSSLFL